MKHLNHLPVWRDAQILMLEIESSAWVDDLKMRSQRARELKALQNFTPLTTFMKITRVYFPPAKAGLLNSIEAFIPADPTTPALRATPP